MRTASIRAIAPRLSAMVISPEPPLAGLRAWWQMPTAQFMAVFGPYSHRIDEVLDRFDPALLAHAARDVADDDIELPLRPEEATR